MTRFTAFFSRCRWPGMIVVICTCAVVFSSFWITETPAELNAPSVNEQYIAKIVALMLKTEHLSRRPLNDESSRRGFETFLDMLDPLKLYFLQSDVDEFSQRKTLLDDDLVAGKVQFAHRIFARYLKRMDKRIDSVESLLEMEHDFTADEEFVIDPDHVEYAKTEEEAQDRWRKRIKYELLLMKANEEEKDKAKERIARRLTNFAKRQHQIDNYELLEKYLTAMTTSLDPHTTYMSPDTLKDFHINMSLNLEGIGAALSIDDGYTVVTKIIRNGAADKAGQLKPEDRIISVGQGVDGEMEDVIDMKLRDVVKKIRGKAGSVVRLGVVPAGTNETKIYEITRARIELKDSEARGEILDIEMPQGGKRKIGVIVLPSFYMDMKRNRQGNTQYKSTTRDVLRILGDFNDQGVEALILDLRNNGGGSLPEAISLTGLFIDQGPVVQVKGSDNDISQYEDRVAGMSWNKPLIVLTNKFSASASEILAGAVQDYRRGLVIGDETTHGKGTVQSLQDVSGRLGFRRDFGALKVTMQQFYRPSGASTQEKGVEADITLPSITSQMEVGEADLDYAIQWDRVDKASFRPSSFVNDQLVAKLKANSIARRNASEDFQELMRDVRRYREQKDRISVSLNEEEFLAERKELNADEEDEKQMREQIENDETVFDRDFYTDEVVAIMVDYLQLLEGGELAKVTPGVAHREGT